MLDVFITSRVRRKIIVVYAKYPDFKTHVRGLAKLIKEDPGNIQRELRRLEKAGFLISEKRGNTKPDVARTGYGNFYILIHVFESKLGFVR